MAFKVADESDLARSLTPPREENPARLAFGEYGEEMAAELLPLQEELYGDIKEARARIAEAERGGAVVTELREQAKATLSEHYFIRQAELREAIEDEFAKAEKKWREGRDPTRELLNLTRWQQRFAAMNENELEEAIADYCRAPAGRDPDEVECLLAAAVRKGSSSVQQLRRAMAAAVYDKPWLAEPSLEKLHRLHHIYSAGYGQVRVLGKFGIEDVLIGDLF